MNKRSVFIIIAGILVALSVLLYYIHYLIFHDTHHIFIIHDGRPGFPSAGGAAGRYSN